MCIYIYIIYICVRVVNPDCSSSFERIWRANESLLVGPVGQIRSCKPRTHRQNRK